MGDQKEIKEKSKMPNQENALTDQELEKVAGGRPVWVNELLEKRRKEQEQSEIDSF